jgi:hypothetical protein
MTLLSPTPRLGPLRALLFVPFAMAFSVGCLIEHDDGDTPRQPVRDLDKPSYISLVQPVVERRCGSLDCHGKLPRGFRVYGQYSLRLPNDAGLVVGSGATTPDEALATYVSLLGLQPELMDAFARKSPRTSDDAYGLLILSKPLGIERHRPGPSIRKGEPAERCITSWMIGATDASACMAGAPPLK